MAPAVDERNLRINGINGSDSLIDSSGFGVGEIDRLQIRIVLLQFFQLYPAVGIARKLSLNSADTGDELLVTSFFFFEVRHQAAQGSICGNMCRHVGIDATHEHKQTFEDTAAHMLFVLLGTAIVSGNFFIACVGNLTLTEKMIA